MTFHVFYSKTWRKGLYLSYDSEVTLDEIVDSVLHDPVKSKLECPAVILNRFKIISTEWEPETVKNRYKLLERTTGWFGLDVDDSGKLTALTKRVLFDNLPELRLVWVSSSGQGVKAIGYTPKLENLTPQDFRTTYNVMVTMFRHRCHMQINFDPAMNRCHQPIFINTDPNAFVR